MKHSGFELTRNQLWRVWTNAYRMTAVLNFWKMKHSGFELTRNQLWGVWTNAYRMAAGLNFWKMNIASSNLREISYEGSELMRIEWQQFWTSAKWIIAGSKRNQLWRVWTNAYRMAAGLNFWKMKHSGFELTRNQLWRVWTKAYRMTAVLNFCKMNHSGFELTRNQLLSFWTNAYRMTAGLNFWKMNHSGFKLKENECRINYKFELMQTEWDKVRK
jgi:hypothetical protein